jgi:murein DD-endopeptidase MepM/ murein hydrolase activator NlpD
MIRFHTAICIFIILSSQVNANNHLNGISGEILIIPSEKVSDESNLAVFSFKDTDYAVIGLPYVTKKEQYDIASKKISVKPKDYGESRITIEDQSKVILSAEDKDRTFKEYKIINNALSTYSKKLLSDFDFSIPVNGIISSRFGKKRFINDLPRSPHLALDIAAPENTEILAPSDAIVILTGEFFYAGNYVMLDHGMGLISSYSHLSNINVKEGEYIKKGMLLGMVGSTGRVTGPHLHWSIYLNKQRVNPEIFLDKNFFLRIPNL